MNLMYRAFVTTASTALLGTCMLTSCALLGDKMPAPLRTYVLNAQADVVNEKTTAAPLPGKIGQVLLVEIPHAASGYESTRMLYSRQALTQEAFVNSAWADTPARMLAPMLVERLRRSGQFRAVLLAPSAAKSTLRLDTTILHLQQDFLVAPSRVRLTLQVTLLDNTTREVRASHTVDVIRNASSEDAAGGAHAAHAAVQEGLGQVVAVLADDLAALP